MPNSDLDDFTLSNARRFYLSKGDPLGTKGLKRLQVSVFLWNLKFITSWVQKDVPTASIKAPSGGTA